MKAEIMTFIPTAISGLILRIALGVVIVVGTGLYGSGEVNALYILGYILAAMKIKEVARLANCEEFICKLPQGYDTPIGENGATLSGEQRQRISIARAFLKDASIITLDEIAGIS